MKMSIDKEIPEGDVVKSWNFRIFFTKADAQFLHILLGLCWAILGVAALFGIPYLAIVELECKPLAGAAAMLITPIFLHLCGNFIDKETEEIESFE
jgi:hypothetical protein